VGFVAHIVAAELFIASYWTSGPEPPLIFVLVAFVICGGAIGSMSAEPVPRSARSMVVGFVTWYFVVSGIFAALLFAGALLLAIVIA
jgi:hypothetical protein